MEKAIAENPTVQKAVGTAMWNSVLGHEGGSFVLYISILDNVIIIVFLNV